MTPAAGLIALLLAFPAAASADPDLAVQKIDATDPVTNGDDITYTVTVSNEGPDASGNYFVVDPVPTGTAFKSASAPCVFSAELASVVCSGGPLAASANETYEIVLTTGVPGDIANTAAVSYLGPDEDPSNDSATQTTHVRRSFNLGITSDLPPQVAVRRPFVMRFGALNTGPNAADGVEAELTLPADVTFLSASAGCAFASQVVTCNAGTLGNRGVARFEVHAQAEAKGEIRAPLTVRAPSPTADQEERSTENNTKVLTITAGKGTEPAPLCHGQSATIVDRSKKGDRSIRGTGGRDVILAGSGRNRIRGRGGNDVICGGGGNDSIQGGGGSDRLFGGDGRDKLNGASGRDVCVGGPGRNRERSCELENF